MLFRPPRSRHAQCDRPRLLFDQHQSPHEESDVVPDAPREWRRAEGHADVAPIDVGADRRPGRMSDFTVDAVKEAAQYAANLVSGSVAHSAEAS